ncbi:hypothetical protein ACPV52_20440 [Vibrio astriarenae]
MLIFGLILLLLIDSTPDKKDRPWFFAPAAFSPDGLCQFQWTQSQQVQFFENS